MNKSLKDRYVAGMVLSAVGDALGYRNGQWEFCADGQQIHSELESIGGLENISVMAQQWPVSDDTVMHLATAHALIKGQRGTEKYKLLQLIAQSYKGCTTKMMNRHPGSTCMQMVEQLNPSYPNGLKINFNPKGGGCGAAMRAMCIGLRYPWPQNLDDLILVSIESGRLTHHHPTGYLGSLASALFTSYAVQEKELKEWGVGLINTLEKAKDFIENRTENKPLHTERDIIQQNTDPCNWDFFRKKWEFYLGVRDIADGKSDPIFPPDYSSPKKRDQFYALMSFDGVGGASGHDAPMIAYDAILYGRSEWKTVCDIAMFHGGDSDSTGVITACLFGVLNGFDNVPKKNYQNVEFRQKLEKAAKDLYYLANDQGTELDHADDRTNTRPSICCTM